MTMLAAPTEVGAIDVAFRTRFADEGYESPVPREMWIDVRGSGDAELPAIIAASAPPATRSAQAPAVRFQR